MKIDDELIEAVTLIFASALICIPALRLWGWQGFAMAAGILIIHLRSKL